MPAASRNANDGGSSNNKGMKNKESKSGNREKQDSSLTPTRRKQGSKSSSSSSSSSSSKNRATAIIEQNKKTEFCKNYPHCKYGSKCAFAHSPSELRRLSLTEMEQSGRIPNASKFRCYPCLTWLATGSCPYRERCVFIHDPRVKGDADAYLYATPGTNASRQSAKSSPLFWPDMPLPGPGDSTYQALYSACLEYEVHPKEPSEPTFLEECVKLMWENFTSVMQNLNRLGGRGACDALYGPTAAGLTEHRLPIFAKITTEGLEMEKMLAFMRRGGTSASSNEKTSKEKMQEEEGQGRNPRASLQGSNYGYLAAATSSIERKSKLPPDAMMMVKRMQEEEGEGGKASSQGSSYYGHSAAAAATVMPAAGFPPMHYHSLGPLPLGSSPSPPAAAPSTTDSPFSTVPAPPRLLVKKQDSLASVSSSSSSSSASMDLFAPSSPPLLKGQDNYAGDSFFARIKKAQASEAHADATGKAWFNTSAASAGVPSPAAAWPLSPDASYASETSSSPSSVSSMQSSRSFFGKNNVYGHSAGGRLRFE